jgi:leucyl aminopeptidase
MQIKYVDSSECKNRIVFCNEDESKKITSVIIKSGDSYLHVDGDNKFFLCNVNEETNEKKLIDLLVKGVKTLSSEGCDTISIIPNDTITNNVIELGVHLGDYTFDKYKSEKAKHISTVEIVYTNTKTIFVNNKHGEIIAKNVNLAKDLVNTNANECTPEYLESIIKSIKNRKCKLTVIKDKELEQSKLNLIKAVGGSSKDKPALIVCEYNGNKDSKDIFAIVGKGVTFDSGGYSIKPAGSMETMKCDMAGAAAAIGAFKSIVEMNLKVNVVIAIPAAQNGIGSNAFFPGDVVESYSGKTVEILNTDAEGRLVLADAISYVKDKYNPTEIVDIATLTGAIVVALGDTMAGHFYNDDKLSKEITDVAIKSNEQIWPMPVLQEHSDQIKSNIADIKNMGKAGCAGASAGAAFIKEFVGDTPWCHLDIAGVAFDKTTGATGYGVRLLTEYIKGKTI